MITCEVEGVHKGVTEASQQAARDARARLRYRGREPEAASPAADEQADVADEAVLRSGGGLGGFGDSFCVTPQLR